MRATDAVQERQDIPAADPIRGDVAIVGMGCVFAGAPNLDAYWANILGKVDSVSDPDTNDWNPAIYYDPESRSNDRVYCKRGGYIGNLAEFRPTDFGIMPIAVDGGEPDQWLSLRVAHEALTDAGYADSPKEHVRTEVILGKGTYVNRGNLTVGYHGLVLDQVLQVLRNLRPEYSEGEIQEIKDELKGNLPPFNADTAPALIGNIIAGRIANRLDLMGPSFTVDAACASALLAIEIGVRDLLTRKCDLVLAGGANVNAPLPTLSLFCQLGALSRKERIRPFDKNADGTILGEGLGMIVLKRREDAERDGNRIYAIIKGVGLASDGRALHVMAPRVEGEELALRRAYDIAGVSPKTVGLMEAHGTATPVGDVVELQALARVFGEREVFLPSCAIGSVKSMIGHTMPAAGIAGVIKTALALYHRVLPPTLNVEEPNPALHLERTPFYVNTEVRPWIHGLETPRRAGVNSFGFGGINAHVVLEEHPDEKPDGRSHLLEWDSEVCIFTADSREALIERCGQFASYLEKSGNTPIKDIAYSLNCRDERKPVCLAIVTHSREDLGQKLQTAATKLTNAKTVQIKDNAGIFYFQKPLDGKLAFLFPGEGAQYPNMLLDLCIHFPEVRACFDRAEKVFDRGSRKLLPGDFIFPRTIVSEEEQAEVKAALWEIDGAVASVLIGNSAMSTLLSCLDIRPDAVVGHSSGDYAAMVASGLIQADELVARISSRSRDRILKHPISEVTLIAIASDAARVQELIASVGGDVHLAMDNCPHQTVVAGEKVAAERLLAELRSKGFIYEVLPFDRPYHTPLFRDFAEAAEEEYFGQLQIKAPSQVVYSCTSCAPYPDSAKAIRQLFIDHWSQPVLFTDTIRKMYDDGVRLFVEAGPRGNLTAFVSDILRGKPHLAMPANVAHKSGITQINHLVGILAAQGVPMRLDYLYERRSPKSINWEQPSQTAPNKKMSAPVKLSLALPPLKIKPREKQPVAVAAPAVSGTTKVTARPSVQPIAAAPAPVQPPPAHFAPVISHHSSTASVSAVSQSISTVAPVVLPSLGSQQPRVESPTVSHEVPRASNKVMSDYLRGMEAFLDVEAQVMGAFLRRANAANPVPVPKSQSSVANFPLLGTITSHVPGKELTAERELRMDTDLFLRDHALGGPVSDLHPDLTPIVVLPLTMGMEVLAEGASALVPHAKVIGMRGVRAHRWIQVNDPSTVLHISAKTSSGGNQEVFVQIRTSEDSGSVAVANPVLEGTVLLAPDYPLAPAANSVTLKAPRVSRLAGSPLYEGRLMFHGPRFQGVTSVDQSGQSGILGQLNVLTTSNLFRDTASPTFVTDPVVLDAAGQLVGFWAAEYLDRAFVVFPYQLEELRMYGPNRPVGERLTCSVQLQLLGSEGIRSDIEVAGSDGSVWMSLKGWADLRFDTPQQFHNAWTAPRTAMLSQAWRKPTDGIPQGPSLACLRLDVPFGSSAEFWNNLWASVVLSPRERKTFASWKGTQQSQLEWLSCRTVAKDAIRTLLQQRYGLEFFPADIEIAEDDHGKPIARTALIDGATPVTALSVACAPGVAAAVVGDSSSALGIDIGTDTGDVASLQAEFLNTAEQAIIEGMSEGSRSEWVRRLVCAKRATLKALGRELLGHAGNVHVLSIDMESGVVSTQPELSQTAVQVYTATEGTRISAIAVCEERES